MKDIPMAKAKDHYVYSTASNDTLYSEQVKNPGGISKATRSVLIKGGANVVNGRSLHTPRGVATRVSNEDMEFLLQNKAFKRHKAAGYVTHSQIKDDADEVAKKMKDKDGSAQETPESIAAKAEAAKKAAAGQSTTTNAK